MDNEVTLEDECENLMNIVVESRKRFGKMCKDYHQKALYMEKNMLNLQLQTIANYRFKPKNTLPALDVEDMNKDIDDFAAEILERRQKIDRLKKKITDTQNVVLQLKEDNVNKKMAEPLTAEFKLARAMDKNVEPMKIEDRIGSEDSDVGY